MENHPLGDREADRPPPPEPASGATPAPAPVVDAAFVAAYRRHLDEVWRYARRRTAGAEEADDVAAEVFATAWRRRDELPPDPELRLWLFGTARRVLANHHRAGRRRDRLRLRLAAEPAPPPPPRADTTETRGLRQALASLSADDRDLLIMRCWDELAVTEIAVLLGCSPNAASLRLHKARGRLAATLAATTDPVVETDPAASRTSPGRSPAPEGDLR